MDGRCSLSDQFSPIVYCPPRACHQPLTSATRQTFQAKPLLSGGWQPLKMAIQAGGLPCKIVPPALHRMQCIYIQFLFGRIFSLSENRDIFGPISIFPSLFEFFPA